MYRRYAFACAYLACYLVTEVVYVLLSPSAQAALTAWASTSVANLEHEPVGPLVLSAFIGPGYLLVWPVLIALALFGANRALGNVRTALICVAGQVIGTVVSEGIVAYRVDAGQLPAADRYLTDVGPSYVVVSAIVIAVVCGTWLARAAAALDFAVLVFGGHIFSGLSQLDVSAVGHLTALVTAAAGVALVLARGGRPAPAATRRRRTADRAVVLEAGADEPDPIGLEPLHVPSGVRACLRSMHRQVSGGEGPPRFPRRGVVA